MCCIAAVAVALSIVIVSPVVGQQGHEFEAPPLPEKSGPLRSALMLLRMGKTAEARAELEKQRNLRPDDAEVLYQIARSYLMDFYKENSAEKRRVSLGLAMETLNEAVKRNPDHVPSLRALAVIHARPELLYYDPNLSWEMANRVAKLEPHANAFLMNLSEWLSGEIRFTKETGHRVPQDPLIGLDRSINLIEQVIDGSLPFSNDEMAALFLMGNTLARRGNFREAIMYYKQELERRISLQQRTATLRELGDCYYRLGEYADAAANFYEAMQWRMNTVDQWLFRVALDQIKGELPPLPPSALFPPIKPKIDAANPPKLAFEDIAPSLGIHHLNGNGTCAWGDIDGDGDLDLIVAGSGVFIRVYRNDGNTFPDITEAVGLAKTPSGYALNLVDYDNDGWLDLYVSLNGWSGPERNKLFHNEHGKFVDVSKQSGLDDPGDGFVAMWGDLDNDGWIDVVLANGVLKDGTVPQIYRNNRDGTFTNVTKAAGVDEPPEYGTIGVALGDYDKDGRLDIFFNGLDNSPNRLYHNDGNWRFTEVARKAGVTQALHNGFVAFFEDYNNDAWPDLITTSLAPWEASRRGPERGIRPFWPESDSFRFDAHFPKQSGRHIH